MGEFQAINKCLAVVLVLLAYHEIVITQGRQIKALKMNKDTSIDGTIPTSAEKAVGSRSPSTTNHLLNAASEDSNGDHIHAYRPTPPGNSPGVGHRKFGEENKDIKAKVVVQSPPDVEYYSLTEGSKTDFRPTDPGHCPGIGHSSHHQEINT